MEPILVIAVIVAGAVGLTVSLVAARAQRAVRVHSWRRAAAEAGLTLVGDGPTSGDLTARAGDLHLRMQEYHRGHVTLVDEDAHGRLSLPHSR